MLLLDGVSSVAGVTGCALVVAMALFAGGDDDRLALLDREESAILVTSIIASKRFLFSLATTTVQLILSCFDERQVEIVVCVFVFFSQWLSKAFSDKKRLKPTLMDNDQCRVCRCNGLTK